jgi:hypothetical protein
VDGWAGKAHAAHGLSGLASYGVFCFLDADVRIPPTALTRRMHASMEQSGSALVSGFSSGGDSHIFGRLLLPLIHFLLRAYLPLAGMRAFPKRQAPARGAASSS